MYPSQVRCWLTFASISLMCCGGCNQPPQRTAPGALPGRTRGELEPRINAMTYFAHGHLLERQGQFERAVVQYRKAVALRPDFLSARNRLGITLNKLGRHFEATEQFQRASADHRELAYLHNNLGFSLYLEEKHAAAEAALQRALELKPDFPRAHMNRALVLARLARFDDAFSELLLVGNEADACFNMGIILTDAGRYADAANYLEAALAVKPDFDAARQQLREVSRLAAEAETRQAANLTLAAETIPESAKVAAGAPPAVAAKDTADTAVPPPLARDTADTGAKLEPAVAGALEATAECVTAEPTEACALEATAEDATAELAEVPALEATAERVTTDVTEVADAEAAAEDATPEPMEAATADASASATVPLAETARPLPTVSEGFEPLEFAQEPGIGLEALFIAVDEALAPLPEETGDFASEPSEFAREPGIDTGLLFAVINEALKNQADNLETLWCQVSYYLFPETAPHEPTPEPD